jgi:hypothetical protein
MEQIMRGFLLVLVMVGTGIVGLGFYRGWFQFDSDNSDGKSNVTLTMDTDKFQKDRKTAVANVQDAGRQLKDKVTGPGEKSMDGTVVSVSADKLTMTGNDKKEHSHALAGKVNVTCDGKTCTAADLKAGMKIRVTTDAANAATRIEALDKNLAFANGSHDGKIVSITADRLVMTSTDGKAEHAHALTADVKVTCDGKACKAADLKPGMRVRVTAESAEPHAATHIEALDANAEFDKGV